MTHKPSILFCVGLEGHLYVLEEVRRRFGAEIAGVVLTEEMQRHIESGATGKPDRLYSFPDYYRRQADAVGALDSESIRMRIAALERQWRIPSTSTLFYYDRYIRRCRDYRRSIELMLLYMEFCAWILECEDPIWLKSNISTFVGAVLHEACLSQGVPSLKPRDARISGRLEFMNEVGNSRMRGWRRCYEAALAGSTPQEVVATAEHWLASFRDRPMRPEDSERNSVVSFSGVRLVKGLWDGIATRFDRNYWDVLLNCPL